MSWFLVKFAHIQLAFELQLVPLHRGGAARRVQEAAGRDHGAGARRSPGGGGLYTLT